MRRRQLAGGHKKVVVFGMVTQARSPPSGDLVAQINQCSVQLARLPTSAGAVHQHLNVAERPRTPVAHEHRLKWAADRQPRVFHDADASRAHKWQACTAHGRCERLQVGKPAPSVRFGRRMRGPAS